MSHHLHSLKTEEYGIVNVVMGYDPSGGHIFCTVNRKPTTGRSTAAWTMTRAAHISSMSSTTGPSWLFSALQFPIRCSAK